MTIMPVQSLSQEDKVSLCAMMEKVGEEKVLEYVINNWYIISVYKYGTDKDKAEQRISKTLQSLLKSTIEYKGNI